MRNLILLCACVTFLAAAVACSKHVSESQLSVEISAGFSGNFVLNMGVRGATPLRKKGDVFVVAVPRDGKVETSTLLARPQVIFKNAGDGRIWGYSHSEFATGDGISTGGKIEFFVGTQQEFDAEQNKKNKSGGFPANEPFLAEM